MPICCFERAYLTNHYDWSEFSSLWVALNFGFVSSNPDINGKNTSILATKIATKFSCVTQNHYNEVYPGNYVYRLSFESLGGWVPFYSTSTESRRLSLNLKHERAGRKMVCHLLTQTYSITADSSNAASFTLSKFDNLFLSLTSFYHKSLQRSLVMSVKFDPHCMLYTCFPRRKHAHGQVWKNLDLELVFKISS